MRFVEKNTHAMTTGRSISGLGTEHTCSEHWLIHVWFVKRTHMQFHWLNHMWFVERTHMQWHWLIQMWFMTGTHMQWLEWIHMWFVERTQMQWTLVNLSWHNFMYATMYFIVKDTHFPFLYYSALPLVFWYYPVLPLSLSFVDAQTCAHSICYALIGCHSCHADRAHQPWILCDPTRLIAHVVPFTV